MTEQVSEFEIGMIQEFYPKLRQGAIEFKAAAEDMEVLCNTYYAKRDLAPDKKIDEKELAEDPLFDYDKLDALRVHLEGTQTSALCLARSVAELNMKLHPTRTPCDLETYEDVARVLEDNYKIQRDLAQAIAALSVAKARAGNGALSWNGTAENFLFDTQFCYDREKDAVVFSYKYKYYRVPIDPEIAAKIVKSYAELIEFADIEDEEDDDELEGF